MGYSIDVASEGCYPGTTCLINKLGIQDEKRLEAVEAEITVANLTVLEQDPIPGEFDFKHYKEMHRFLFGDLYDWAGQVRRINISKKGTAFAAAEEIDALAEAIFARVAAKNFFLNESFEEFMDDITDLYCSTNMLHPFREGNGRTQRAFLTQLIRYVGYDINFDAIDPDEILIATIHAAQGITEPLRTILGQMIGSATQEPKLFL